MLEKVDDYKELKSYLDGLGIVVPMCVDLSRQMANILTRELKIYTRQQQINFEAVRKQPSLIRDDELLNQYADGEISLSYLREQLGNTKFSTYMRIISDATKWRNELKLPILKEMEGEICDDEDYKGKIDCDEKLRFYEELDKYYKYLKPQYTLEEFKQKVEEFREYYHDYINHKIKD